MQDRTASWDITPQLDELRTQGLWRELRPLDEVNGVTVRAEGRILKPSDWSVRGDAIHLEIAGRQQRRAAS